MQYEDFRDGVNLLVEELTRRDKLKEMATNTIKEDEPEAVSVSKASSLVAGITSLLFPTPQPANE